VETLRRMESFNDGAQFVRCMADLVAEHLAGTRPTTRQLYQRCPSCTNDRCRDTKAFFHTHQNAQP
jgi:protoporphyrin/coproporphyrin ferrochelatase